MRILLVSEDIPYPSMGGLAKHALTLASALVRAGHTVDLLGGTQHPIEVAGAEGQFGGSFFGELDGHIAGWKEIRLGVYLPPRRTWIARRFARIILRHADNYDVIHYHGHAPNVALFIPEDVNFVQTRHDQGSDCLMNTRYRNDAVCETIDPAACASCRTLQPNPLQTAITAMAVRRYRKEVAAAFQRHKTVFVSELLQRNFTRAMGPGQWGITVHNFIDTERVRRAREQVTAEAAERRTGFDIFVAAKLYPAKGVGAFLREAVPRLQPGMRITVAGNGEEEAGLRAAFEGDAVRFLGWCHVADTLLHAARADAVVVPSLWEEPFGATTLEGLLLGKQTFALARGGTPELKIYVAAPDQLRLFDDMAALVDDLLRWPQRERPSYAPLAPEVGGTRDAVETLLRIYRLPPGRAVNTISAMPKLQGQR
jgi:glycogen(starch) synthase